MLRGGLDDWLDEVMEPVLRGDSGGPRCGAEPLLRRRTARDAPSDRCSEAARDAGGNDRRVRRYRKARMLTLSAAPRAEVGVDFAELRAREFGRLDAGGHAYLDYTGSALYPERLVTAHAEALRHAVLGNPHSESPASRASTALVHAARERVLRFFDADPDEYVVCFTANTTGGDPSRRIESSPSGRTRRSSSRPTITTR